MTSSLLNAVLFVTFFALVTASDPNIITDFVIPANSSTKIGGDFFTFTDLRGFFDRAYPPNFKVTKASMAEFPALNGQSVSFATLEYPAGTINPPHTHPRSAELLLVVDGTLEVGFIDTTNKLYSQTLQLGDMFVFPKGLCTISPMPMPRTQPQLSLPLVVQMLAPCRCHQPCLLLALMITSLPRLLKLILVLSRRSKQVSP